MSKRKTSLIDLKQISEINMTPLMDLTFILLITFIITFPLIEQGVQINLPKGNAAELEDTGRAITINADGELFLDDLTISSDRLAEDLKVIGRARPDTLVYVRADEKVDYGKVASVMTMLHAAGITKIALVTEAGE